MKTFDNITVIYNPNSTGDAPRLAKRLVKNIKRANAVIGIEATLTPTEYAGHAAELAETISKKHRRPLIVSVSGDGGFNEVVNGAMRAKETKKAARPVVAVLAAGNANDHDRVMKNHRSLLGLIRAGNAKPLDLIRLDVKGSRFSLQRYAHSYIGFGITPEVGVELNKHELNILQEIRIVLKAFFRYEPFTVEYEGAKREVDSLIFANINEMAKVLKLNQKRNVTDDQFEVVEFAHKGKVHLLWKMLYGAVKGFRDQPQYSEYTFKTFDSHPVQLDGEIEKMPRRATVSVTSLAKAIDSLYQ